MLSFYRTRNKVSVHSVQINLVLNPSQSYGGNIITMFSDEDKRLVNELRREESMLSSAVLPSLWTMKWDFKTRVRDKCGK